MIAAIRSEALKVTSTRIWWILALVLVGYIGLTGGVIALGFSALADQMGDAPLGIEAGPLVYSTVSSVGYVFPLILGALAVTGEYRFQTLTPTFLASPRRATPLLAKLVVLAVFGAVLGVVGLVATIALGGGVLALTGNDNGLGDGDTWLVVLRIVVAMAIWAAVGVGIGTLVPNQIASIIIVLAFTQVVEPILRFAAGIWEWTAEIGKFLPGAASDALVGTSLYSILGGGSSATLEWWQGGLALLALAAVFAVLGYLITWRRDVT